MARTRRQLFTYSSSRPEIDLSLSQAGIPIDRVRQGKQVLTKQPPVDSVKHTGPHPDDATLPAVDPLVLLLNRASFGFKESEYQRALSLDYTAWLQEQLNYTSLDNSALEASIASTLPRVNWTAAQLIADAKSTGKNGQGATELIAATLLRQIFSPRQLYEVMVEFWTNHFNIAAASVPEVYYKVVDDRDVIRPNALGSFPAMLKASARSLAMLYYLDNVSNTKNGPNENYARELMELHTLGVEGGYTEIDVKEVARCFTGWTVTGGGSNNSVFTFSTSQHDTGTKTVLGNTIAAGGGMSDGDTVLNILATHPSTARYIAEKLCLRFIGEHPQTTAIDQVAATYTATNGNISAMLLTLFGSVEFMSAYDRKIRRPVEYLIGALRVTEPSLTGDYLSKLSSRLTTLGQIPFKWPTPDGYPDEMADWVNTGASLTRWNWVFGLAEDKISSGIRINVPTLISTANTPQLLVDRLSARLLRRALTVEDRDRFISFAANGGSATQVLDATSLNLRARELIGLMLASKYFQYR
ncbi:MAG: DUF1800 domain-containing protein [Arenimonas sp.]